MAKLLSGSRIYGNAVVDATLTSGNLAANSNVASTSTTTGALRVTGGAGISGNVYVGGDIVTSGNLTINGTTTNINTTNLVVEDKNIIIADVASPTNVTADGAGITVKGSTDKTFNWVSLTAAWTSSEDLDLLTGKQYEINGTSVLTATTLGSGVVNSSLTSVGNLTSLSVNGTSTFYNSATFTAATNNFGELTGNATFNGLKSRPINFISNSATMRVARPLGSGDPAVELLGVNWADGSISSWWDFFVNTDQFNLRRRTNNSANITLRATQYTTAFPETNVAIQVGTVSTSTTTGALQVTGGVGISGAVYTGGNITVTGHVLPSANVTYDLGSPTQRWKDLYLSGNTLVLGQANIQAHSSGITIYAPNQTVNLNQNLHTTATPSFANITATGNLIVSARLRDYTGNAGLNGQLLVSTGTSVQWVTRDTGSLESLSDVNLSSPQVQQVLTYDGTNWVNADSNATVASAVFASSQSDLGYVTDLVLTITEDEGSVADVTNNIYDLGVLSFTGIISLNNIDQSIKSDYLGYSIIFGF